MDISVIVPVYNVEPVFERCLRSLFGQSKTDGVEFIFINDCTPDGSMAVLERVMTDYPNLTINIINHPENRGVAATRLTGLDAAIGEYTIQIDSDDWCEPTMLEDLYNKAKIENADIVVSDYYSNDGTIKTFKDDYDNSKLFKSKYIGEIFGGVTLWNKLIRRALYINNNIMLDCNVNYGEDRLLVTRIYCCAKKISYVNKPYLHYMTYINSLTYNHDENSSIKDRILVNEKIHDFMTIHGIYQKNRDAITYMLLHKERLVRAIRGQLQKGCIKLCSSLNIYILQEQNIKPMRRIALFLTSFQMSFLSNCIYALAQWASKIGTNSNVNNVKCK